LAASQPFPFEKGDVYKFYHSFGFYSKPNDIGQTIAIDNNYNKNQLPTKTIVAWLFQYATLNKVYSSSVTTPSVFQTATPPQRGALEQPIITPSFAWLIRLALI
jgi:hypothetical protein